MPRLAFRASAPRAGTVRAVAARYAVAWAFLAGVTTAGITWTVLPGAGQAAVLRLASTNVHNLHTDPVGCPVVSAFFPSGPVGVWPLLIALAMFGACHVLGNWWTVVVCGAGHVIGTLVSEGIEGYRVSHGTLPPADRFITDVGPSYVVVAAIAVVVLYGPWLARAAALLDLAVLIFPGEIFSGLGQLHVAAVGHATALVTGALAGSLAVWQRRARDRRAGVQREDKRRGGPGPDPSAEPGRDSAADQHAQAEATAGRRAADQADQPRPPA